MKPAFLSLLLHHCQTSEHFYQWIDAVLQWADANEIEVAPASVGGDLCVKITMHDSRGSFFDFVYPMNRKKSESETEYADRVSAVMHKECAEIRRQRIVFITGREPAARAA